MQIYAESIRRCCFFSSFAVRKDCTNVSHSIVCAVINFQVLFVADFIKQEMEPCVFSTLVISLSVEQMALSKSSLRGILRKFDIEQWSHWRVRFNIGW